MRWMKFSLVFGLLVALSCAWKPTPLAFGPLVDLNNEVQQLYLQCLDGRVFDSAKDGCDKSLLEKDLKKIRIDSQNFISADIKQPQGYDIFLKNTLIFFAIGVRTLNDYSEAARIARQFFEIQKATSGQALTVSRYYWVMLMAEYMSYRYNNDRWPPFREEQEDLALCLEEGVKALPDFPPGTQKANLADSLFLLQILKDKLDDQHNKNL